MLNRRIVCTKTTTKSYKAQTDWSCLCLTNKDFPAYRKTLSNELERAAVALCSSYFFLIQSLKGVICVYRDESHWCNLLRVSRETFLIANNPMSVWVVQILCASHHRVLLCDNRGDPLVIIFLENPYISSVTRAGRLILALRPVGKTKRSWLLRRKNTQCGWMWHSVL